LADWRPIIETVEEWAYPQRQGEHAPDDVHELMRSSAAAVICKLLDKWGSSLALRRWVAELGQYLELNRQIEIDPDFLAIYPIDCHDNDWRAHHDRKFADLKELADRWQALEPRQIANRLSAFELEASSIDLRHDRLAAQLGAHLAELSKDPFPWIEALTNKRLPGDIVAPFVSKAIECSPDDERLLSLLSNWLSDETYQVVATFAILALAHPPEELIAEAIDRLADFADKCEFPVTRGQVSPQNLRRLLAAEDEDIRLAAAWGLWERDNPEGFPTEYRDQALNALRHETKAHRLDDVFSKHPSFALTWLEDSIDSDPFRFKDDAITAATSHLSAEQRRVLIDKLDTCARFDS
jgi:hypothetical protein